MKKKEMITEVSKRIGGTKIDAEKYIDCIFDVIMDTVATNEEVKIIGFGKFSKEEIKGRTGKMYFGKNKGKEWKTEDSWGIKFKVGKVFEDKVNGIVSES